MRLPRQSRLSLLYAYRDITTLQQTASEEDVFIDLTEGNKENERSYDLYNRG